MNLIVYDHFEYTPYSLLILFDGLLSNEYPISGLVIDLMKYNALVSI